MVRGVRKANSFVQKSRENKMRSKVRVCLLSLSLLGMVGFAEKVLAQEKKKEVATAPALPKKPASLFPEEKHLKNLRQLTFGGDNAEAYWAFSGKQVVFQSNNKAWGLSCDQIFTLNTSKKNAPSLEMPPMVSTGLGRTTCAFFMPSDEEVIYASTHEADKECPAVPERRADGKYLWPVYSSFDIYVASSKTEGHENPRPFIAGDGYDAEATVSPKGDKIVFTSARSGDLELYVCDIDGSNIKQITSELGYDGGAFFSPDGKRLVFRASRPKTPEAQEEYRSLLKQDLVAPTEMEIFTCNIDGSDLKQITKLGKANWAPFFTPNGKSIVFSSNHKSERGFQFNLYKINIDGSGLEQITYDPIFASFPMFSPNGKQLIFSSNRNANGYDTNLFIADWVE